MEVVFGIVGSVKIILFIISLNSFNFSDNLSTNYINFDKVVDKKIIYNEAMDGYQGLQLFKEKNKKDNE